MLWKNDQFVTAPRKKHESVTTAKLKNIWPEIVENQRLGRDYRRNNRHKENLGSKF